MWPIPWAPTGSSSSNTPRPIRSCCAACSSGWVSRWSPVIAARTSRCIRRATSISSSTPSRNPSASASRRRTGLRCAPWRFACSDAAARLRARRVARRRAASRQRRADGAQHPGHRRHRRVAHLLRRSLRRSLDLRRRLHAGDAASRWSAPGSRSIDHLTHNVHRGHMDKWTGFYETLFNFREIRYFDIEGKKTGLFSRAPDQSLRQDPHSDQRVAGRQVADRGIPARVSRRGHPAHRARPPTTSIAPSTCCAAAASRSRTRRRPTTKASMRACHGSR